MSTIYKPLLIGVSEDSEESPSKIVFLDHQGGLPAVLVSAFFLKPILPPPYKSDLKPAIYDGFLS